MDESTWSRISREQRTAFVRDALEFLEGADRTFVLIDLARVLKSRAPTIERRRNEVLALDLARSLTLLRPPARMKVLMAAYHGGGPRAQLFNNLVGLVVDAPPEGLIAFDRSTLEPYSAKYGDGELELAIDFVAEHGHVACRDSARGLREARIARELAAERLSAGANGASGSSMQEGSPELSPASPLVADAPADEGDQFLDGWREDVRDPGAELVGATEKQASGVAAVDAEPGAAAGAPKDEPRRGLSDDWSTAEMRDDEVDRTVIRAIVASINREDGALDPRELRSFVVKLQRLNTARYRSYFYLGFVDALQSQPAARPGGGMNSPRRAWYLAGYHFGMRRMKSDADFLDGIEAMAASDLESLSDRMATGAAQKLLGLITQAAIRESRGAVLSIWLGLCGPCDRVAVFDAVRFALKEQSEGPVQNVELLETCRRTLRTRGELERLTQPHAAEVALFLSIVGCLREQHGRKQFTEGLRHLRRAGWSDDWGVELCTACAMHDLDVAGPLRLVPQSNEALQRLARELPVFARRFKPRGHNAVIDGFAMLLRVIAEAADRGLVLSQGDVVQAVESMQLVRADLATIDSARFATYPKGEFTKSIEVLAALAVVVTPLEDRFAESAEAVLDWIAAGNRLPTTVLRVAFENLLLLENPIVADFFVECVKAYGPDFVTTESVARIVTVPEARAAREVLREILEDDRVELPIQRRWEFASVLGRAAAAGGVDPQLAIVCLDYLERIVDARPRQYGLRFIELLADPSWENVLPEELRDSKQAAIASRVGDYTRVGQQLSGMLQSALAAADAGMAADSLETLDAHGLGNWASEDQRAHLRALLAEELGRPPSDLPHARVLFVGGNEVQAAYDGHLRQWFAKEAPQITIEFIHSGWKSNWTEYVGQVERRLQSGALSPDAIVVITMIRTILGKKVRALAGEYERPWVSCTGRGLESLRRSALKAAQLGAAKRSTRQGSRGSRPE